MKGFLLALQFFTIIPIHKELPMTKKHITTMFSFLPIIGAFIGGLVALLYYALEQYTDSSPLFVAFIILMTFVILTGGLHLDGFIDMGDAYFSYRNIEKRHEILADPRIGAFGAMSLVFLILAKFIVYYEILLTDSMAIYWLLLIPFLSRIGMAVYLVQTPTSKESGIGAFFKSNLYLKGFAWIVSALLVGGGILFAWWSGHLFIVLILIAVTLGATILYRNWTIKNFNGSSGDLYGAFIEGMELILWLILLFLL